MRSSRLFMLGFAGLIGLGLAPSVPQTAANDEAAIRRAVQFYFDGSRNADSATMRKGFRTEIAHMLFVRDQQLVDVPIPEFLKRVAQGHGADFRPDTLPRRVVFVDVSGNSAVAKLETVAPNQRVVDYMALLKINGEWLIVNKIFDRLPREPSAASAPDPAGEVKPPSWLAGCWEQRSGNRQSLEMWMPPASGLMLGASRTVSGGNVREYEQMAIKIDGDKLVYTATPSAQQTASFTSTVVTDSSFTVENPQHDFPQRIIYRRHGMDSLIARIEGPGSTGTRGFDYPMGRVSCTTSGL